MLIMLVLAKVVDDDFVGILLQNSLTVKDCGIFSGRPEQIWESTLDVVFQFVDTLCLNFGMATDRTLLRPNLF